MKLHQTTAADRNLITACETDHLYINQQRHNGNLIITPNSIQPWSASTFAGLQAADFSILLDLQPELVIFGSGHKLRFPHASLARALTEAGIGMEVMDTRAACRSYNILMAEDRKVVLAILQETTDPGNADDRTTAT